MFDVIFYINCSSFTTSIKNLRMSDIDVSFEDAKHTIILDNYDSLPSNLFPKHLSFEIHMISHIMAATCFQGLVSLDFIPVGHLAHFLYCYSA